MKRRAAFALAAAGTAALAWGLKPREDGAPYSPYFAALNSTLRRQGPGRPCLIIDLDRLEANVQRVLDRLPAGKAFRLVAKSLPSSRLIEHVSTAMRTQRLMVFHQPHLNALAQTQPQADLLVGKPMPVNAAATFYRTLGTTAFDPRRQLQWLIDTPQRLQDYAQLARQCNTRLRLNLEIDVGLHRGGAPTPQALDPMLDMIATDPLYLELAGLMGYDAHVGKVPGILESRDASFADACARYQAMQARVRAHPAARQASTPLVFNGAGSPTLRLHHDRRSPLSEVAAGSCFVKPTDFDLDLLGDLQPAAYIATPVLKVMDGLHLPGLEHSNALISAWDPNWRKTYFIYGGLWQAHFASPAGLHDNALYGVSSNQAIVNSSTRVPLNVDDYVFLRPTQSERVLLEFGDLTVVRGSKLVDWWPVLPT